MCEKFSWCLARIRLPIWNISQTNVYYANKYTLYKVFECSIIDINIRSLEYRKINFGLNVSYLTIGGNVMTNFQDTKTNILRELLNSRFFKPSINKDANHDDKRQPLLNKPSIVSLVWAQSFISQHRLMIIPSSNNSMYNLLLSHWRWKYRFALCNKTT